MTIEAATAAAQRGDWTECLELLVAAWQPQREPELATIIERVAERVIAPSMEPSTKAVAARVATATVSDVSAILATIRRQLRKQPRLLDQVLALARRLGPDPRIARLLAEIFETTPFARASSTSELPVLDALIAIDDPRFRETVVRVAKTLDGMRDRYRTRSSRIDRIVAAVAELPAPTAARFTGSLAGLEAELARRTPVDLTPVLAAIYADPDNTAVRLVYADALQERGDPRGEFIALQCANATLGRRERALLRIHAREWLGAIDPHVSKTDVVFRRGFVAAATLLAKANGAYGPRAALAEPEWHTLEEIDLGNGSHGRGKWLATLRGLRRVAHLYGIDFTGILEGAPVQWRSFGLRHATKEFGARFAKHHAALMPLLEELDLSACTHDVSNILTGMKGGEFAKLRMRLTITLPEHVTLAIGLGFRELEIVPSYQFLRSNPAKIVIANGRITHAEPELLTRISALLPVRVRSSWKT